MNKKLGAILIVFLMLASPFVIMNYSAFAYSAGDSYDDGEESSKGAKSDKQYDDIRYNQNASDADELFEGISLFNDAGERNAIWEMYLFEDICIDRPLEITVGMTLRNSGAELTGHTIYVSENFVGDCVIRVKTVSDGNPYNNDACVTIRDIKIVSGDVAAIKCDNAKMLTLDNVEIMSDSTGVEISGDELRIIDSSVSAYETVVSDSSALTISGSTIICKSDESDAHCILLNNSPLVLTDSSIEYTGEGRSLEPICIASDVDLDVIIQDVSIHGNNYINDGQVISISSLDDHQTSISINGFLHLSNISMETTGNVSVMFDSDDAMSVLSVNNGSIGTSDRPLVINSFESMYEIFMPDSISFVFEDEDELIVITNAESGTVKKDDVNIQSNSDALEIIYDTVSMSFDIYGDSLSSTTLESSLEVANRHDYRYSVEIDETSKYVATAAEQYKVVFFIPENSIDKDVDSPQTTMGYYCDGDIITFYNPGMKNNTEFVLWYNYGDIFTLGSSVFDHEAYHSDEGCITFTAVWEANTLFRFDFIDCACESIWVSGTNTVKFVAPSAPEGMEETFRAWNFTPVGTDIVWILQPGDTFNLAVWEAALWPLDGFNIEYSIVEVTPEWNSSVTFLDSDGELLEHILVNDGQFISVTANNLTEDPLYWVVVSSTSLPEGKTFANKSWIQVYGDVVFKLVPRPQFSCIGDDFPIYTNTSVDTQFTITDGSISIEDTEWNVVNGNTEVFFPSKGTITAGSTPGWAFVVVLYQGYEIAHFNINVVDFVSIRSAENSYYITTDDLIELSYKVSPWTLLLDPQNVPIMSGSQLVVDYPSGDSYVIDLARHTISYMISGHDLSVGYSESLDMTYFGCTCETGVYVSEPVPVNEIIVKDAGNLDVTEISVKLNQTATVQVYLDPYNTTVHYVDFTLSKDDIASINKVDNHYYEIIPTNEGTVDLTIESGGNTKVLTITVLPKDVAFIERQIDDHYVSIGYPSISEAVYDALDGEIVNVYDVSYGSTAVVDGNKNITVNLNMNMFTLSDPDCKYHFDVKEGSTLTLIDGRLSGIIELDSFVKVSGTCNMNGIRFMNVPEKIDSFILVNGGTLYCSDITSVGKYSKEYRSVSDLIIAITEDDMEGSIFIDNYTNLTDVLVVKEDVKPGSTTITYQKSGDFDPDLIVSFGTVTVDDDGNMAFSVDVSDISELDGISAIVMNAQPGINVSYSIKDGNSITMFAGEIGDLTLEEGKEYYLGMDYVVSSDKSIIIPEGSTLFVTESSTLTIEGTLNNSGFIDNKGIILIEQGANITNNGTIRTIMEDSKLINCLEPKQNLMGFDTLIDGTGSLEFGYVSLYKFGNKVYVGDTNNDWGYFDVSGNAILQIKIDSGRMKYHVYESSEADLNWSWVGIRTSELPSGFDFVVDKDSYIDVPYTSDGTGGSGFRWILSEGDSFSGQMKFLKADQTYDSYVIDHLIAGPGGLELKRGSAKLEGTIDASESPSIVAEGTVDIQGRIINGNLTLKTNTLDDSFVMTGDLTVEHGATLTIEDGALLEIPSAYQLFVSGTLLVRGTVYAPEDTIVVNDGGVVTVEGNGYIDDSDYKPFWMTVRNQEELELALKIRSVGRIAIAEDFEITKTIEINRFINLDTDNAGWINNPKITANISDSSQPMFHVKEGVTFIISMVDIDSGNSDTVVMCEKESNLTIMDSNITSSGTVLKSIGNHVEIENSKLTGKTVLDVDSDTLDRVFVMINNSRFNATSTTAAYGLKIGYANTEITNLIINVGGIGSYAICYEGNPDIYTRMSIEGLRINSTTDDFSLYVCDSNNCNLEIKGNVFLGNGNVSIPGSVDINMDGVLVSGGCMVVKSNWEPHQIISDDGLKIFYNYGNMLFVIYDGNLSIDGVVDQDVLATFLFGEDSTELSTRNLKLIEVKSEGQPSSVVSLDSVRDVIKRVIGSEYAVTFIRDGEPVTGYVTPGEYSVVTEQLFTIKYDVNQSFIDQYLDGQPPEPTYASENQPAELLILDTFVTEGFNNRFLGWFYIDKYGEPQFLPIVFNEQTQAYEARLSSDWSDYNIVDRTMTFSAIWERTVLYVLDYQDTEGFSNMPQDQWVAATGVSEWIYTPYTVPSYDYKPGEYFGFWTVSNNPFIGRVYAGDFVCMTRETESDGYLGDTGIEIYKSYLTPTICVDVNVEYGMEGIDDYTMSDIQIGETINLYQSHIQNQAIVYWEVMVEGEQPYPIYMDQESRIFYLEVSAPCTVKAVWKTDYRAYFNEANSEMISGEQKKFTLVFYPAVDDPDITWSSSDEDVLYVDQNGYVTALSEGTASVIVTTELGQRISADVNVIDPLDVIVVAEIPVINYAINQVVPTDEISWSFTTNVYSDYIVKNITLSGVHVGEEDDNYVFDTIGDVTITCTLNTGNSATMVIHVTDEVPLTGIYLVGPDGTEYHTTYDVDGKTVIPTAIIDIPADEDAEFKLFYEPYDTTQLCLWSHNESTSNICTRLGTTTFDPIEKKCYGSFTIYCVEAGITDSFGLSTDPNADYSESIFKLTVRATEPTVAYCLEGKEQIQFTSIQDALSEANGRTIYLMRDVELDGMTILAGQTVSIDLQGRMMAVDCESADAIVVNKGGSLTLMNGDIEFFDEVVNAFRSSGRLTLSEVSVSGKGILQSSVLSDGGELFINDSYIRESDFGFGVVVVNGQEGYPIVDISMNNAPILVGITDTSDDVLFLYVESWSDVCFEEVSFEEGIVSIVEHTEAFDSLTVQTNTHFDGFKWEKILDEGGYKYYNSVANALSCTSPGVLWSETEMISVPAESTVTINEGVFVTTEYNMAIRGILINNGEWTVRGVATVSGDGRIVNNGSIICEFRSPTLTGEIGNGIYMQNNDIIDNPTFEQYFEGVVTKEGGTISFRNAGSFKYGDNYIFGDHGLMGVDGTCVTLSYSNERFSLVVDKAFEGQELQGYLTIYENVMFPEGMDVVTLDGTTIQVAATLDVHLRKSITLGEGSTFNGKISFFSAFDGSFNNVFVENLVAGKGGAVFKQGSVHVTGNVDVSSGTSIMADGVVDLSGDVGGTGQNSKLMIGYFTDNENNALVLGDDLIIESGSQLVVESGSILVIGEGKSLTVKGTLTVEPNAGIDLSGTIIVANGGLLQNSGTICAVDANLITISEGGTYSGNAPVTERILTESVCIVVGEETVSSITMTNGDILEISYSVLPANATFKNVVWSSSNENIVTIVEDAGKILLKASAPGATVIRVTTIDSEQYADCSVTIEPIQISSVTLSVHDLDLKPGDATYIAYEINPEDADIVELNWTSSNEDVVVVSKEGLIQAIAVGEATVTLTSSNGLSDSCKVKVSAIEPQNIIITPATDKVAIGGKLQFTITLLPLNTTDKSVVWTVSDSSIGEVDQNGLFTGKSSGTVLVTVTSAVDSSISVSSDIEVMIPATSVTILSDDITMFMGQDLWLDVELGPEGCVPTEVTWYTSDSDIVTVNNGLIRSMATGSVTITASLKNDATISDSITVTVIEDSRKITSDIQYTTVVIGESVTGMFTITPEDADISDIIYEIVDNEVLDFEITYDDKNGVCSYYLTGKQIGLTPVFIGFEGGSYIVILVSVIDSDCQQIRTNMNLNLKEMLSTDRFSLIGSYDLADGSQQITIDREYLSASEPGYYPVEVNVHLQSDEGKTIVSFDGSFLLKLYVLAEDTVLGDLDNDNLVTSDDAIYLLYHTFNEDDYPIVQIADYDSDGLVTSDDAIYLLYHTFNEDDYPIDVMSNYAYHQIVCHILDILNGVIEYEASYDLNNDRVINREDLEIAMTMYG